MKRLLITLVVAGAMLLALPATAKKPPTEPPPVLVCEFDGGVLINSEGDPIELDRANSGIRCQLAAEPSDSFKFVISGDADVVLFPYIAVTDVYPYGGDICFRDYVSGRVVNPDNEESYVFGTFATEGSLDTSATWTTARVAKATTPTVRAPTHSHSRSGTSEAGPSN